VSRLHRPATVPSGCAPGRNCIPVGLAAVGRRRRRDTGCLPVSLQAPVAPRVPRCWGLRIPRDDLDPGFYDIGAGSAKASVAVYPGASLGWSRSSPGHSPTRGSAWASTRSPAVTDPTRAEGAEVAPTAQALTARTGVLSTARVCGARRPGSMGIGPAEGDRPDGEGRRPEGHEDKHIGAQGEGA